MINLSTSTTQYAGQLDPTCIQEAKQSSEEPEKPKILVVDDEAAIRLVLGTRLKLLDYDVRSAADGEEALEQFREFQPDLVILDVMLPKIDGFAVCKEIRKLHDTPLIMLSAVGDVTSRIHGLESGADDYIIKPFSPSEVEARIKAILRRQKDAVLDPRSQKDSGRRMSFGDLRIDFCKRQVTLANQRVRLTGMEFNLLEFLVRNAGKAFSRNEIFERVWHSTSMGTGQTLRVVDVHISRLRCKIELDSKDPQFIQTARGIGYMFNY